MKKAPKMYLQFIPYYVTRTDNKPHVSNLDVKVSKMSSNID